MKPTQSKKTKSAKRSRRTRKPAPIQGAKPANRNLIPRRERDSLVSSVASLNSSQIATYPGGMSMFEYRKASTPGGIRVKGREAAGTLLASATTATGAFQLLNVSNSQAIDSTLPLQPFFSARLERLAEIFEHYKFHEWCIDIIPYKPTSTAGVLFGTVDLMGSDDPFTTFTSQSTFLNGMINCIEAIYSIGRMVYTGNLAELARYACSIVGDGLGEQAGLAFNMQARAAFGCQGVNTTVAESLATLVVTYDVEFFAPCTPETSPPPNLSGLTRGEIFRRLYRERCPPASMPDSEMADLVRQNRILRKILTGKHTERIQQIISAEVEEELKKSKSALIEGKNDPANETDKKTKFDPRHSDGDIPNICHFAGFTGTYMSTKKESYLMENHHLQLGDGKRFYVCPETDNTPIDLLSTSRVGIPDPFVIPSLDTTLLGASPEYYPSIKRINFCPCGCNDPRHEEGLPGETICVYCGNEDGHVPTPDWVNEFQCHLAALDPRSAIRSMPIDDFYKCCSAIWSVTDFSSQECWEFYLAFLNSPLCENFPCKGEGKETMDCNCAYQYGHLCCLSPTSLTTLMRILSSKDAWAFTMRADAVKVQELVKTLRGNEKLAANPDFQRRQLEYLFKRQVKEFFLRRQALPVFDSPREEDTTQYGHAFERSFTPPEDCSLCRSSD